MELDYPRNQQHLDDSDFLVRRLRLGTAMPKTVSQILV